MTRALCLLLFLAAPAWGQTWPTGPDWVTITRSIVCGLGAVEINGKCHPLLPPQEPLSVSVGTLTSHVAECDPGWVLVMDTSYKPQCAWVLKEPTYK